MNRKLSTNQFAAGLAAVLLALACPPGTIGGVSGDERPEPDPAIQSLLQDLAQPPAEGDAAPEAVQQKLAALEQAAEGRHVDLVQQLFLFALNAEGMRAAMLPGVLLDRFEVSKRDLALGLVPLLSAEDKAVREQAANWLGRVDRPDDGTDVDLSVYEELLGSGDLPPSPAFVRYLKGRDAAAALSTLEKALEKERATALWEAAEAAAAGAP